MRILLAVILIATFGCAKKNMPVWDGNCTIPTREYVMAYTVFEEKDGLYYTDKYGMDSLYELDELNIAYIEKLKERLRMCRGEVPRT